MRVYWNHLELPQFEGKSPEEAREEWREACRDSIRTFTSILGMLLCAGVTMGFTILGFNLGGVPLAIVASFVGGGIGGLIFYLCIIHAVKNRLDLTTNHPIALEESDEINRKT